MRSRRTSWVSLVVLALAGCGSQTSGAPDASQPPTTARECRQQWQDLKALHGENGNPQGSVTVLVEQWDARYQHGLELETTATARDCGAAIDRFAQEWDGLESLMYGLHPYDMPLQLSIDEGNRRHWVEFQQEMGGSGVLSSELQAAFGRLRVLAPRANADLAPVLSAAGDVEVADAGAVDDFVAQVADAAEHSESYQQAVEADRVIDDAELDEE